MKRLFAALLASTLASAAYGSGPVVSIEPPTIEPAAYDWTGFHIGLFGSVLSGSNFWAERSVGAESTPAPWTGDGQAGLTVGYDMQRGDFVFGVAADVTGGMISATSTTSGTFGCLTGCVTDVDQVYSLRGRVGHATDRALFYATAGFASGNVVAREAGLGTLGSDRRNGWVAGFGGEIAATNNLSIFAEILRTDLGRLEIPTSCFSGCYTDVAFDTVRFGANLRW